MSSSTQSLKFLLDENVRVELARHLKNKGYSVKLAPKGSTDLLLVLLSKKEGLILVTNDSDFESYTKEEIYSVILLKIPQNEPKTLIKSFSNALERLNVFKARLIILKSEEWESFPLFEETSS